MIGREGRERVLVCEWLQDNTHIVRLVGACKLGDKTLAAEQLVSETGTNNRPASITDEFRELFMKDRLTRQLLKLYQSSPK